MSAQGILILDKKDHVVSVALSDILELINNAPNLYWSILFLDGVVYPEEIDFINMLKKQISDSPRGAQISFEDLLLLSSKYEQMYEIVVIGVKDMNLLHQYKDLKEMHRVCDISIELVDCAFWVIHSQDSYLIKKIENIFHDVKLYTDEA